MHFLPCKDSIILILIGTQDGADEDEEELEEFNIASVSRANTLI
jgi:hypothetical protein